MNCKICTTNDTNDNHQKLLERGVSWISNGENMWGLMLVASLLLVMPGATFVASSSSVRSDALCSVHSVLAPFVAMPEAPFVASLLRSSRKRHPSEPPMVDHPPGAVRTRAARTVNCLAQAIAWRRVLSDRDLEVQRCNRVRTLSTNDGNLDRSV